MIVPGHMIEQYDIITPFCQRTIVGDKSYGVGPASYDVRSDRLVILRPHEFGLTYTIEHFKMPDSLLAVVHDKSSWARQGLTVQNTIFNPSWRGTPVLELCNHGPNMIIVQTGDPIAQIVFHMLFQATTLPYVGKTQDQVPE